jgi:ubiquinone/menaquinone biosynthesis C-methylase UbiE
MTEEVSIEAVKSFWNSRPCNVRHSNAPFGSRLYFDEVEQRKYFVEPHIPEFADFGAWNQKKVLEIGCGIGTDAINFARAGADYTGVDLSIESLKITQDRFDIYGLSGRLFEANAENIHSLFRNEKFDLIYSFGVLHHTPDIEKCFESIHALCHKQTKFKFMVYAKNSWKNAMVEAGLDQPEAQHGCPLANVYSVEDITTLLQKYGFCVTQVKQDHIFPYIVESYLKYEYRINPWFEVMPKEMFDALQQRLGWHLMFEAQIQ